MTSMLENPTQKELSNMAKTHFRFNKKHDHGTRANPGRDAGEFSYNTEDKRKAQENWNVDEGESEVEPHEGIFDDDDLDVGEFELIKNAYPDYLNVSEDFRDKVIDHWDGRLNIDDLVVFYQIELRRQSGRTPSFSDTEMLLLELLSNKEADFDNNSTIDGTHRAIGEYENRTDKEIRDSLARAATLDTYENDDFGDYHGNSHIRVTSSNPFDKDDK